MVSFLIKSIFVFDYQAARKGKTHPFSGTVLFWLYIVSMDLISVFCMLAAFRYGLLTTHFSSFFSINSYIAKISEIVRLLKK